MVKTIQWRENANGHIAWGREIATESARQQETRRLQFSGHVLREEEIAMSICLCFVFAGCKHSRERVGVDAQHLGRLSFVTARDAQRLLDSCRAKSPQIGER